MLSNVHGSVQTLVDALYFEMHLTKTALTSKSSLVQSAVSGLQIPTTRTCLY